MMNADGSFLDRLCDRAAQPVNPSPAGGGGEDFTQRSAVVCSALS